MSKPLNICIDIRDLRIAKTGSRTYLDELAREFQSDNDPNFKFIFLDSTLPFVYTGKNKWLKLIEQLRFLFWKQVELPLKAWYYKADIVFCTDFFVPWIQLGYTTIPVFHDAFFWEYPAHYNKYWRWLFLRLGVSAAKKSFCIITPTFYTQTKIAAYSNIHVKKIIPIYEAPKSLSNHGNAPSKWNFLKEKKYILHVGTFEKRKNLIVLLQAFHSLKKDYGYIDLELVLVGQLSTKSTLNGMQELYDLIHDQELNKHIHCTGYIEDEYLGFFYKHASVYAFPSLNEGFGIPILESFKFGVPVVIANNTCLPEVAGNAALSFAPFQPKELAELLNQLLCNDALRDELIERGKERVKEFSWQKTAAAIKQVFIEAYNAKSSSIKS